MRSAPISSWPHRVLRSSLFAMAQLEQRGMGQQAPSGFNYTEHNCNTRPLRKGCGARIYVAQDGSKYRVCRFRCKSYACGRCGPRKIRRIRKRIVGLAVQHHLTRFLTLTLDPKKLPEGIDVRAKIAYLQAVWRKMREYIRRYLGRSLVFVAVLELQGNGNPHLHLLIDEYLPKEWISKAWQAIGGGWATRIERAQINRVAAYLAKYLTDESVCCLPSGTRRFSTSKGLSIFDRSTGGATWLLLKTTIEQLRGDAIGVESECYETEPDGARALASFVADRVPSLSEPLHTGRLSASTRKHCG